MLTRNGKQAEKIPESRSFLLFLHSKFRCYPISRFENI